MEDLVKEPLVKHVKCKGKLELDKEVNIEKQDYAVTCQEALTRIHHYYVVAICIESSRGIL
eukprot:12639364-Ditylum_brightwellii.AAC.1